MRELGSLIEREMQQLPTASFTLTDVARRRDRRSRNRRIRAAMVAAVISAATLGGLVRFLGELRPEVPAEPGPGAGGRIVFVSPGDGGPGDHLYSVAPDGAGLTQLASVHAEYPRWSPDGSSIAFDDGAVIAFRDWSSEEGHLFVVNADGSQLRQLATGEGAAFAPAWSPDGANLAFSANGRPGTAAGIFILDLATGATRRVTTNPYAGYLDKEPDYSPDGQRIVFVRDRELIEAGGGRDRQALFVVNVDGSHLRRLTPWSTAVGTPSWSPDGSTIVFRRGIVGRVGPLPRIFVIGANGTSMRPLTPGSNQGSFWPSWSPDGTRIVFTRFTLDDGRLRLFTIAPDGSDPTPLLPASAPSQNEAAWGSQT